MKAVPESPPQSVVSDPSSQRAAVAEMVGRSASSDSGRGKRAEIPEKVRALFSSVEAAAAATADGSAGGLASLWRCAIDDARETHNLPRKGTFPCKAARLCSPRS